MSGSSTAISANMVLEAIQPDLVEQAVDECMFSALTSEAAEETGYDEQMPPGVVQRKTQAEYGKNGIEFGMQKQLKGRGVYNGATLSGLEEPVKVWDNVCRFVDVRHGVPFDLKGLQAFYNKAFPDLLKKQRGLSIWNGITEEIWAFQSLFKRVPDEVYNAFGSDAPQLWHPYIYTANSSGLTRMAWSATTGTYQGNVATGMGNLSAGMNINIDRIEEVEVACADQKIRKVRMTVDGAEQDVWIWAYPRKSRARLKKALRDFYLEGDVRGPNNRALRGEKFKYGSFLFVEANYIPRVTQSGGTLSLQEAWAYDEATDSRLDNRTELTGLAHMIIGEDGLCKAEPETLQWDEEDRDYKRKTGIATYRMMGFLRGAEFYDNRKTITDIWNNGSLVVLEHATT